MRDIILGRIPLPAKEDMTADSLAWRERELALETAQEMYEYQGAYILHLIEQTDYPTFDIDGVNRTFLEWKQHKKDNIMTFRDHSYRSLMAGTVQRTLT